MPSMSTENENSAQIRQYYKTAEPFYKYFWHGNANGLHYGFWEPTVKSREDAIAHENEVLAALVNIKHGERVLDAGSGIGGSALWLVQHKGADVVELDLARTQLRIARKLSINNNVEKMLSQAEGSYHELPFGDKTFDVFWSLESIEHATKIEKMIQEAYRVLKPGGRAIIAGMFMGKNGVTSEEVKKINRFYSAAGVFHDFQTAAATASIMRQSGFSDVQNIDKTAQVMKSSEEMARMCRLFMPAARIAVATHIVPAFMLDNQKWGTYQEDLFKSGAISYNILQAQKPK